MWSVRRIVVRCPSGRVGRLRGLDRLHLRGRSRRDLGRVCDILLQLAFAAWPVRKRKRREVAAEFECSAAVRGEEEGSEALLHIVKTDINVLSDVVKVFGRRESDEATGSKQHAKRSQRAGRLIINRTRQKSDFGEPSYFD